MELNRNLLTNTALQESLQQLAFQTNKSSMKTAKNISSVGGKFEIWNSGKGKMPEWAAKHIEIHLQLQKVINQMEAQNKGEEIPKDVIKILKDSNDIVRKLANKVNYPAFLKAISPSTTRVDNHGLLKSEIDSQVKKSQYEWQLNLGLLMNAYNGTKNPEMKKQIEFLALNYLAKAAPIELENLGLSPKKLDQFEEMFQLGGFQEATYHREAPIFDKHISKDLKEVFANPAEMMGNSFLTDTSDFQELIPLFFTKMDTLNTEIIGNESFSTEMAVGNLVEGWSNNLSSSIIDHFKNNPDPYNQYINPPLMLDLTDLISKDIQTNGDEIKETLFKEKMNAIENGCEKAIDIAISKIKNDRPEICQSPEDEQKLRVFLKFNVSCMCRSEVKEIGVLKSLHIFTDINHYLLPEGTLKFLKLDIKSDTLQKDPLALAKLIIGDKHPRTNVDLVALINYAGLRLGGVSGREKIFNFMDLREFIGKIDNDLQMTEYAVSGKNVAIYENKNNILTSALFKRTETTFSDSFVALSSPHVAILGNATVSIFAGLMKEISDDKWKELNDNPDTRMILQQALFRSMQHLAEAERSMNDFTKFSQSIELMQSEIATILTISSPFKEGDFQKIYTERLNIVPDEFKSNIKAGVSKSAMNTFAGINAAVQQMAPSFQRAHGDGVYFEEVSFIGENRTTQETLDNKDLTSVDLYVGEFNHNINVRLGHHNYDPGAVKDEIRQILKEKTDTKNLTVAIDVTIDFVNSPKAKELLEEFSKEIKEGQLNFVFFRSGQKFEMFGMDNYYGSPFWMVNNGGEQWKGFNNILTKDAHKTDSLSMQWFCLANKYAPQGLDDYRGQIFQNTRSIINDVPADFKMDGQYADRVRISTFSDGMEPCFIDIKILEPAPDHGYLLKIMKKKFAKRYVEAGVKMHQRSSFGFVNANWNVINAFHDDGAARNVRINPGLNPEENKIILDFIKEDIPLVLKEIDKTIQDRKDRTAKRKAELEAKK